MQGNKIKLRIYTWPFFHTSWRLLYFKSMATKFPWSKFAVVYVEGHPCQHSHRRSVERYLKSPSSCTPASWSNLSLFMYLNALVFKRIGFILGKFKASPSTAFVPFKITWTEKIKSHSKISNGIWKTCGANDFNWVLKPNLLVGSKKH